ncbi:MAG: trigger factor, partial [Thermodesulfobacteriota bacterium]|nr:trigger factor [Thermodesulfobacteriota bacterium]
HFAESIYSDVSSKLVESTYKDVLEQHNLKPVSQLDLEKGEIHEGSEFVYQITFEVKPKIEVDGYNGLELEKKIYRITDEHVDKVIEELQNYHATLKEVEVDREATKDDHLIVDWSIIYDEKVVENMENFDINLSSSSILNQDDVLIGVKKGEERDVHVTLPEDYPNSEIAAKAVTIKVSTKSIREKILPTIDDEFAKDLGEYENLADLRTKIYDDLGKKEEERTLNNLGNSIVEKLLERHNYDVPESLVEQEIAFMQNISNMRLQQYGFSPEELAAHHENMKEDFKAAAEKKVKGNLILEAIAEKEGLQCTEAEIDQEFEKRLKDINLPIEDMKEYHRKYDNFESIKADIVLKKTIDFILDKSNIKITEVEEKESET